MAVFAKKRGTFGFWYCIVVILIYARNCNPVRSDKEMRERFYGNLLNSSAPDSSDGSIAQMFDRVLEKEFPENDQPEGQGFGISSFVSRNFLGFAFLSSVWLGRKFREKVSQSGIIC
jgi:hypothetical protein